MSPRVQSANQTLLFRDAINVVKKCKGLMTVNIGEQLPYHRRGGGLGREGSPGSLLLGGLTRQEPASHLPGQEGLQGTSPQRFRRTSLALPRFPCLGHGFHPWWGAKVPHATQCLLGGRKQVVSGKRTLLTPGLGCMLREAGSLGDGTAHCQLRLVTPQQSTALEGARPHTSQRQRF